MIDDGTQRGWERAVMLSGAPQILAQPVLDTLREPILILDVALRVKMANRSFYRTLRVKPEGTENKLFCELGDGQWNIPKLRVLLEEVCFDDRTASMPIIT
jgi:nitrogen-specific signal transduction histidine kinase